MVFGTVGGFIATSVFGLAAGSAGATIVGGLIGGGLAFGAQSLLGEYMNRSQARPMGAIQGTIKIGGDIPAEAVYGRAKTKGQRLYYAKYGPGDEFNSEVLVLSNGWCDGLEPYVYFYGEKHNLVELPKIGNEVVHYGVEGYWYDNNPNGDNCFSIRFYDGRPGQQVDQKLVDDTANLGRVWKPNSTVTGHTYVVVRMRFDGDADFADNGRPELEFVLRGLRLYDPRKDSTVAGGSGTHRIDDPSTWEWSENPALQRLNYQLGLRGLISDRTIIGEGKTLGQIDLSTYFASMNVCDALKNGKPTYACSLIVNAEDDHTEVLKVFDDAMAGYGLNRRGLSGVIAGAPQLPMLEITEADIDVGRPIDYRERKNAFELYNHMSGQLISIEDNWKPASLKPIHVNADVAADGRPSQTGYDLLQITDPDIAQYVLTIRYRQQRLGARYESLPVSKRVGLQVEEGKWVTFRGREWLVQGWNLDEDFNFTLTLAETGAEIYDDDDIEPGPIIVPSSPPINPSLLSNVQDFAVEVGIVEGAGGMQAPALRFSWTPPNDATIDYVRFQYGPGTAPPDQPFEDICANAEAGEYVTTKNVEGGHRYVARQTIRTVPDRFKTWGQWVVTADVTDARFSDILDDSVTASKIAEAAVTADKLMNEAVTSIKLAAEAVTENKLAVGAASERVIAAGAVVASKLAEGAVGLTKFASGLTPVEIVDSLPTTGNFEGRTVAINDKLRQYVGGSWTTVNFEGLEPGSVTGDMLADAAVTAAKLQASAVTHEKLSAGSIYGDVVAANAITARELVLTDFSNAFLNGSFIDGNNSGWVIPAGHDGSVHASPDPGGGAPSRYSMRLSWDGSLGDIIGSGQLPVTPGEEWFYSFDYRPTGSGTFGEAQAYYRRHFKDGTSSPASIGTLTMSIGWKHVEGIITIPADCEFIRAGVRLSGASEGAADLYVTNFQLRKRQGATLIVDGAITAAKIDTGAVTTDKLDANTVTSAKIMAGAVKASQVDAGAVTTAKLAIGSANNVLYNASFTMGLSGWKLYRSDTPAADLSFDIRQPPQSYAGVNYPTLVLRQVGSSGSYVDLHNYAPGLGSQVDQTLLPVAPGDRVEASAYISAHRCEVQYRIRWVDSAGATLSYAGPVSMGHNQGSSSNPDNWYRLLVRGTAPAGAVGAAIHIRKQSTHVGETDSYMFVHKPLLGRTVANASEPLEWSPGVVTIIDSDGIATGAVTAAKMLAGTITATEMAAGSITTAKLAAGAITGEKIQGGTITGDKIQGSTIAGEKIIGKSLTIREIIITDFENLVPNGYFEDGDQALVNEIWGTGSGNGQPQLLVNTSYADTGRNCLNLRKNATGASVNITMDPKYSIPVKPGEKLYCETSVRRNESSSSQGGFYFRLMWYDRSGAYIDSYTDVAGNVYPGTSHTVYSGQVGVPAGAQFMRVRMYNHSTSSLLNMLIDRIIVRRAKAADLIVDGGITADKLAVNSLSAITGNVGELVAGVIRSANGKVVFDLDAGRLTMSD